MFARKGTSQKTCRKNECFTFISLEERQEGTMRKIAIICALTGVSLCTMQAQDVKIRPTKTDTLKTVTVDASARKSLGHTTSRYEVKADDYATMGVTTLTDALHHLPGVTLRDYGGAGGMKTVSVRGFGAQHTNVIYDGIALTDAQNGQTDVSRFPLDDVERLSLIVGDDNDIFIPARNVSSAATLQIHTAPIPDAQDAKPHLKAQWRQGAWWQMQPYLRYSQSLSDHFAIQASGSYFHAKNDYPFTLKNMDLTTRERRSHSRMETGHGEVNMTWIPKAGQEWQGKLHYYDNDKQLPGIVHYYCAESKEDSHDRNAFGQMRYRILLPYHLSLLCHAKYGWTSTEYRNGSYTGGIMDQDYWQREAYGNACLLWTPLENWSFDYSADYGFNNLNSSLSTDKRPYRHAILQSLTAKYRHRRITVIGRGLLSLYRSGEKDAEGRESVQRLSPSLSASWQMTPEKPFYLRAAYKNIFRMPAFSELYFYHYGSQDLKPENTDQFSIGVTGEHSWEKGTSLSFTADAYRNHIRDKIVSIPWNMFIWRHVNVGKVETTGLDITCRLVQSLGTRHRLTLNTHYTLQQCLNRTNPEADTYGLQLAYIPQHTAGGSVAWENPWVSLSLSGHGVTERWSNNEHYDDSHLPGYAEMGLTLWHDFDLCRQQHLRLRADLQNLLDKQYEIVIHYPMPGRAWSVTLTYSL